MKVTKHLAWMVPVWVVAMLAWHGAAGVSLAAGMRKVTVRVSDFDTGEPLKGVEVKAFFSMAGQAWGHAVPVEKTACTDREGFCSMTAMASGDSIRVETKPEGYYRFERTLLFTNLAWGTPPRALPWNPTLELRLNRRGSPIPMFAKHLEKCRLPEWDHPFGYDLEAGDWVAPLGNGTTSDILFTMHRDKKTGTYQPPLLPRGYEGTRILLKVDFPGKGNGIQPVLLPEDTFSHFLRTAPECGYEPQLIRAGYYHCPADDDAAEQGWMSNPDLNYYLRVRTRLDERGNVIDAQYGKIYMDFEAKPNPNVPCFGDFTYYLNPVPNDRNIEFGENLFKNLDVLRYEKAFLFP
ncbi:MAG: hypothetical protein IJT88_08990 [Kiritimatiellae bacterium]|nr:hypothetical protein [Kiritimatiellia bacterium]